MQSNRAIFAGVVLVPAALFNALTPCCGRTQPSPAPHPAPSPASPQTALAPSPSQPATPQPAAALDSSPTSSTAPTEREKIERILESLKTSNAVFIRNGEEHSGSDAAAHLRRKWISAGDRITTAKQFIEELASKSSTSGRAYQIRLADGTVAESRGWFITLLETVESGQK